MRFTQEKWIRGTYQGYTDPTECTEFVTLCENCQSELEDWEIADYEDTCRECVEEDDWREDLKAENHLENNKN